MARGGRSEELSVDNGVHNVFDHVEEIDRGLSALFVSTFECVVEYLVVLTIQHRWFAGVEEGVGVLIGGVFRCSMRGGGLPGEGPLALSFFAGK